MRRRAVFVARGVDAALIAEIDGDGDGSVGKHEFLAYLLVHTGKVDASEIQKINALFEAFDRDGSGSIDVSDLARGQAPAVDVTPCRQDRLTRPSQPRFRHTLWPITAILLTAHHALARPAVRPTTSMACWVAARSATGLALR